MTDKKSRRVVIIDNIKSETIDQAIFILKSDKRLVPYSENSVAAEAQNIINSYIRRVENIKKNGAFVEGQTAPSKKLRQSIFKILLLAAFSSFGLFLLSTIFR